MSSSQMPVWPRKVENVRYQSVWPTNASVLPRPPSRRPSASGPKSVLAKAVLRDRHLIRQVLDFRPARGSSPPVRGCPPRPPGGSPRAGPVLGGRRWRPARHRGWTSLGRRPTRSTRRQRHTRRTPPPRPARTLGEAWAPDHSFTSSTIPRSAFSAGDPRVDRPVAVTVDRLVLAVDQQLGDTMVSAPGWSHSKGSAGFRRLRAGRSLEHIAHLGRPDLPSRRLGHRLNRLENSTCSRRGRSSPWSCPSRRPRHPCPTGCSPDDRLVGPPGIVGPIGRYGTSDSS